ncbi:MAG TPA: hypothetical protein VF711_04960 [Acidimicrobiales bacterium]
MESTRPSRADGAPESRTVDERLDALDALDAQADRIEAKLTELLTELVAPIESGR